MLLFIGSALYYPVRLLGIDKGWSIDAANACFLMPTVAISHLFYEFADYEGRRQQLTTENNPLIQGSLYMMAISCVFWGVIAFYFEQTMPQSHGPAFEEPGFICSGRYWCNFFCGGEGEAKTSNLQTYKPGNEEFYDGVRIRNLVKEFKVVHGEPMMSWRPTTSSSNEPERSDEFSQV